MGISKERWQNLTAIQELSSQREFSEAFTKFLGSELLEIASNFSEMVDIKMFQHLWCKLKCLKLAMSLNTNSRKYNLDIDIEWMDN